MRQIVGRVIAINRYPVKSMGGEALQQAPVGWSGLEGDRRYSFVRAADRSHFPWLTARQMPKMLLYQAAYQSADDLVDSLMLTTPDGRTLRVDDPELHAEIERGSGEQISLMHLGRGTYDSSALSVISTTTVAALSEHAEVPADQRRFRANIVVEPTDTDEAFPEANWRTKLLMFGERATSVRARVIRLIPRCMLINLDPDKAVQNPRVLRASVTLHEQCAGLYAVPEQVGTVQVGDSVFIEQ